MYNLGKMEPQAQSAFIFASGITFPGYLNFTSDGSIRSKNDKEETCYGLCTGEWNQYVL
jgi:hypothetical protein